MWHNLGMSVDFTVWSGQVKRLDRALAGLSVAARRVGVDPPVGREWFDLLVKKLRPQLETQPLLVVAVVGGTNIGKSVVFNHLAGEVASGVSPLAAGTRHPVCLTPPDAADEALLQRLFQGFELRRWQSSQDSLSTADEHLLFWRVGANVPPRLLLLDTPDVDSDAQVNWRRAECIRQAADVLVAVLTQQKYNDAAVKQFFRKAVEADKPVVVVFNQCDLAGDADFWPQWLATFCGETGATPELTYVLPYDRQAASALTLPFYEVGPDGRRPPGAATSLRDELAKLHFDAIKIRTLRGAAAAVLDRERGLPAYLAELRGASQQYAEAATTLSTAQMARVHWPEAPAGMLVEEIRQWWDAQRSAWSQKVHGFYRNVGEKVLWPVKTAWQALQGAPNDPLSAFQKRERGAIIEAVENLVGELDRLAKIGNETLRPRLVALLGGQSRQDLLARVQAAHLQLKPLDDDYRAFLRDELDRWSRDNPKAIGFLRSLDHVAAIARPAISISLAFSGWVFAGDVVGQAAAHTLTAVATEAAITGGIAGGGEAAVTVAGEGVKQAATRLFRRLQTHYAKHRAAWLADWLEKEFLGTLLIELRQGAAAPKSPEVQEVEAAMAALATGSA